MNGAAAAPLRFGPQQRPSVLTLVRPVPNHPPLHHVLTGAGYHVWRAGTPAEAMAAALRDEAIAILLCDIVLPNGRGTEFLATLRTKLPAGRPLAAIFMAEAASINDVVQTLRSGASDFIGRRLSPEPLVEAVRRAEAVIAHQRAVRAAAADTSRLAETAVEVARRLAAIPQLERAQHAAAPAEAFDLQIPLEVGASSVHAHGLHARRRTQLAAALRAQTVSQRVFGELMAGNASWAMLIDLYEKTLRAQSVSVSSLCLASGAPTSTALRRLDELVEAGLVLRQKDPADARRTIVLLTESATERLNAYLDAIA